ncbi:hypothetical protein B0H11DRAFT_1760794, partial [Mycena galericulata]
LQLTAHLLGIPPDDLETSLTKRTAYVRKELHTVLLDKRQAEAQCTALSRDIYAILVAFLLESSNRRIEPPATGTTVIALLDTPRFAAPSTPSAAIGPAAFDVFASNFCDELVQGCVAQTLFADPC